MRYVIKLLFLFVLSGNLLSAQTIIDLKPGGGVRAKTSDDYIREDAALAKRIREDSLAYNDCLKRALNALHRDSIDTAEKLFQKALELRPGAPSNYIVKHYLGRISMARMDYESASRQFSKILKERPLDREVRLDRASCYYELNNLRQALDDCQTILASEQNDEVRQQALFLRSAIYRKNRQADLAKSDLEEILRNNPNNTSAQLLIPLCLEDLGQPREALNRMNLFVAAHPEEAAGWVARAELEMRQNQPNAARADYDKAIQLSPNDPMLYIGRAKVLISLQHMGSARKDLNQAVALGIPQKQLADLYDKL